MKNLFISLKILVIALSLTLTTKNLFAQWVLSSSGITGGVSISSLAASGTNIYAGTLGEGIYLSTNNGLNWTSVNNGLTGLSVYSLAVSGSNIFAGTNNSGVFRSTNNGLNWTSANTGIIGNIYTFAVSGSDIYAGGNGGVYLSVNNGGSWTQLPNGLPLNFSATALAISGSNIFAGENTTGFGGIYRSTNGGTNWTVANSGLGTGSVHCLGATGINIFAGTSSGVYVSSNSGNNWSAANNGLPGLLYINTFGVSGTNVFTGTNPLGGLYATTNGGANWLDKNQGFSGPQYVYSILIANGYIFAAKYHSVWRRSYSEVIGIKNINTEIPASYSLCQNFPNPFNPETKINYQIIKNSFVSLKVFDNTGKEIETLVNESQNPGTYEVTFSGENYSSGIYFYRLTSEDFRGVRKMILKK
jgi:photosystem II stability/assembly factor-like uncharacterized protein